MVSAMKKAKTYTLLLDLIDNTNQTANCKNLDKFSVKDLSVPITIPLSILEKSFNDILMDLLYRNKLEEIYDIVSFKDKNCNYYFGPLNKNKATTLFEKIIHNIIDSPQNINIKLTDSLYLTVNGEEVNLPKLLSEVNFSQIILDQDDIAKAK